MTLNELGKMRRLGAKPAFPIVLTDDKDAHLFCTINDLPVVWMDTFEKQMDFAPLHGLQVIIVTFGGLFDLSDLVKSHRPKSLWIVGKHGFAHSVSEHIGREIFL
jgi:hypothetical protein